MTARAEPTLHAFAERSKKIAKEFLQTVVVVDDLAFKPPVPQTEVKKLRSPDELDHEESVPTSKAAEPEGTPNLPSEPPSHDLDGPGLIKAFANAGIVCAVVAPETPDAAVPAAEKAAQRADVVILDWQIAGDSEPTLELIVRLGQDDNTKRRRRLVVIYTGNPGLLAIGERIKAKLTGAGLVESSVPSAELSFAYGSTHYAILAKENTVLSDLSRIVTVNELPERVFAEYAAITQGLVSNASVKALTRVRENLHSILERLGPHLDAAYVSHRALQHTPKDAEEVIESIVSGEMEALISAHKIGECVDSEAVTEWLAWLQATGHSFPVPSVPGSEYTVGQLQSLIEKGFEQTPVPSVKLTKDDTKKLLPLTFAKDATESKKSNIAFARLIMFKRWLNSHPETTSVLPTLQLGTILKSLRDESSYWVCIQPLCDSVRLEPDKATAFPMLKLEIPRENKFAMSVVSDGDDDLRLVFTSKPHRDIRTVEFEPVNGNDKIHAVPQAETRNPVFTSVNGEVFLWLGEFRQAHAQDIVNRFGHEISRPGLTEYEWLRLHNKK